MEQLILELQRLEARIARIETLDRPSGIPTGAFIPFGGGTVPSGYLLCDGSAVSRTTYAALFAIFSTTFGSGDGSTTFNLPDTRGRVIVGKGSHTDVDAMGENDGVTESSRTPKHTHTGPSHTHAQNMGGGYNDQDKTANVGASSNTNADLITYGGVGSYTGNNVRTGVQAGGTGATGSGGAPYLVATYIVKT